MPPCSSSSHSNTMNSDSVLIHQTQTQDTINSTGTSTNRNTSSSRSRSRSTSIPNPLQDQDQDQDPTTLNQEIQPASSIDRSSSSATPDFTLSPNHRNPPIFSSSTSSNSSTRRIAINRAHSQAAATPKTHSDFQSTSSQHPSGKLKPRLDLSRSQSDRSITTNSNSGIHSDSSAAYSSLLQRPGLPSRMTSFISSFLNRVEINHSEPDSSGDSQDSLNPPSTSDSSSGSTPTEDEKAIPHFKTYQEVNSRNLVMPLARTAGPDVAYGFSRGFNNDSPPLTPTSENGRSSSEDYSNHNHHNQDHSSTPQQNTRLPYHTAKHQWSVAQANADAAFSTNGPSFHDYQQLPMQHSSSTSGEISPISRNWAFSPPLTVSSSSSRSSPVQSLRAFSPPPPPPSQAPIVRPNSNSSLRIIPTPTPLGLLPCHSENPSSVYPMDYDYHPGKSPPPIHQENGFASQSAITSSTSVNLTSNRLRISLQSLIPSSLTGKRNLANPQGREKIPWKLPPLRPHLPTIMSILILLVFSTIFLVMTLSTLPLRLPRSISSLTLNEIKELCTSLKTYSESSDGAYFHTLAVLSCSFVFLHAFNVPGSLLLNVVFGATFGTLSATIYTSILTAIGGTGCYLICNRLSPIIKGFPGLEKPLESMRKALSKKDDENQIRSAVSLSRRNSRLGRRNSRKTSSPTLTHTHGSRDNSPPLSPSSPCFNNPSPISSSDFNQSIPISTSTTPSTSPPLETKISSGSSLWTYLLLLRVLPIVPYGIMNVACGVLSVPILPFSLTLGIGSLPWNAVTAQSGEILLDLAQAVSEGFEEFKTTTATSASASASTSSKTAEGLSGISNQINEKLSELDLDLKGTKTKIVEKVAQSSGLKIILKRIWKREMLIRLALLTLLVLAPILIAGVIKKRKENQSRSQEERLRLIREEEEEVLDEEEGRVGDVDDEDEEEQEEGIDQNPEKGLFEMRNREEINQIPISGSASSAASTKWERSSWNPNSNPNSMDSGFNVNRLGHKRMATDG